jgi:hypothetical protein
MGLPTLLWSCCGLGFVLQFIDALFVAIDRPLHQALHDKSALTVVVNVPRHGPEGGIAPPDESTTTAEPSDTNDAEHRPGGTR